jgi:hypothetical protein
MVSWEKDSVIPNKTNSQGKINQLWEFFRTFTRSFNMFCDMIDQIIDYNIMSPLLGDGYKAGGIGGIKTHPLVPKDSTKA